MTEPAKCPNGHEWSHQFGDDWTPDNGALCDCGLKRWGIPIGIARLNALDWDPSLRRRVIVKNRNRYDVKFFFPDGASMRWSSNPKRALTRQEMVAGLTDIINTLREPVESTLTVDAVDPHARSTGTPAHAREKDLV